MLSQDCTYIHISWWHLMASRPSRWFMCSTFAKQEIFHGLCFLHMMQQNLVTYLKINMRSFLSLIKRQAIKTSNAKCKILYVVHQGVEKCLSQRLWQPISRFDWQRRDFEYKIIYQYYIHLYYWVILYIMGRNIKISNYQFL